MEPTNHTSAVTAASPLSVRPLLPAGQMPVVTAVAATVIDRALALSQLEPIYARLAGGEDAIPADRVLEALGIETAVPDAELRTIPASGPLVVVANHPFGAVDGLALLSAIGRTRPDVRILGNELLHRIPELRRAVFFIDPFGGLDARRRNAAVLREALRWLRDGHALAIFPAGEVSHLTLARRVITDPPWHPAAARLARLASAPVLPVFVRGANSAAFHLAGLVHPRLRTLMLPREVLRRRGSRVELSIGTLMPASDAADFMSDEQRTEHLRTMTYVQGGRHRFQAPKSRTSVGRAPLAEPVPPADLRAVMAHLPAEARLADAGAYSVWLTGRSEAPLVVEEIGRLRELTFRQAGEGTGRSRDLDRFDHHYLHLFVWNERSAEIVGAYRIGQTDLIARRYGVRGLYTHTLFRYDDRFLRRMMPALELGRAFVRPEYQREYAPLMLLWKGIGHFVATSPRYAHLFGPVSMSDDYAPLSHQLVMAFLRHSRLDRGLAPFIAPRSRPAVTALPADLAVHHRLMADQGAFVDHLVREVEGGARGLPVLLRHYLKLDARAVAFNVDRSFGNTLDALMVVDLRVVEPLVLQRYMGRGGAERFRDYHGAGHSSTRPAGVTSAARQRLVAV
jgi:putative hemolysin